MVADPELLTLINDVNEMLSCLESQDLVSRQTRMRQILERIRFYLMSLPARSTYPQENLTTETANSILQSLTSQITQVFADALLALRTQAEQIQRDYLELLAYIEQLNIQFQTLQQKESYTAQSLQAYRQQSEQTLLHLDQALKNISSTLEKDLQGYYQSLALSLEQMSNLSQQEDAKLSISLPQPLLNSDLEEDIWYLGLEINPQYLQACLLKNDRLSWQEFPLFWVRKEGIKQQYFWEESEDLFAQLTQAFQAQLTTVDLPEEELKNAIDSIDKLVVNRPVRGEETEWAKALVEANLVNSAEDIYFLETAIARWLATEPSNFSQKWVLVVYGGLDFLQLALIQPEQGLEEFAVANLAYGITHLEQDIFCQLLYPQWLSGFASSLPAIAAMIPEVGLPDPQSRQALSAILTDHPFGTCLLKVAHLTRLILEQENSLTSYLKEQPWQVQRTDIETRVIEPFLEHLARHIADLLSQHQLSPEDLTQVILAGPLLENQPLVNQALKKTFPNKVLADKAVPEFSSRIALGLARYAHHR